VAKTAEMYSLSAPDCVVLFSSVGGLGDGLGEFVVDDVDCEYAGFVAATGWAFSSIELLGQ
jgi:hypothetical protein